MKKRNGFTLVELLIVIAIIAILAGLLFPVFAQAQVSAKQSGSSSNLKQIALGCLLYSNDFDDGLPLFASGNALEVGWDNAKALTWVGQTQPYVKSLGVLVDPLMGDPHHLFGGAASNATYQNAYPDYGLNYVYLAPWIVDPNSGLCTGSGSVSSSGATHPANTVFFTTTYFPNVDGTQRPTGGYSDYGDWIVTAPGALAAFGTSATRCVWPGMDWSAHPPFGQPGTPFTAEASQRYSGGSVSSFLDGHVKYLKAAQEAAGTDWATSEYLHTRVTDERAYLWAY